MLVHLNRYLYTKMIVILYNGCYQTIKQNQSPVIETEMYISASNGILIKSVGQHIVINNDDILRFRLN